MSDILRHKEFVICNWNNYQSQTARRE